MDVAIVTGSAGVIVITGPGVKEYHDKLAQGQADLVRANGTDITSVQYFPPRRTSDDEDDQESSGDGA